jgi:hypothetical protein
MMSSGMRSRVAFSNNRCFGGTYGLHRHGEKNQRVRNNVSSKQQLKHAAKKDFNDLPQFFQKCWMINPAAILESSPCGKLYKDFYSILGLKDYTTNNELVRSWKDTVVAQ